ncbi:MAG: GTP-binding protein, partial [Ruminococcaceae bacterium]|nr:GTP-binding protein [Oscillospiraceae bacterium]
CCSLVGDFGKALQKVMQEYAPDRILIEPSGVGKLSDVIKAVKDANLENAELNSYSTVVDAGKCKMYMKNFGEFFGDQVKNASCVILSHTAKCSDEKLAAAVALVMEQNPSATVVTTDWDQLDGAQILCAMEHVDTLEEELQKMVDAHSGHCSCGCHHDHDHEHEHHHDHDHCDCDHGHEHHHDHDHCDHEHEYEHHHDHDHCDCDHEHEHHHHDHDHCDCDHEHHHDDHEHCDHEHGHCCCGHEHGHDHHHHADEVFTSFGAETANKYTEEQIQKALAALDTGAFGQVLRAKGIVASTDGAFIHFDYVPGEGDVRRGSSAAIGRLCVIGAGIEEDELKKLFML